MSPGQGEPGPAEALLPTTIVWRRIPPWHFPKEPRRDRPDSAAFDNDRDGKPMSVTVARPGRAPEEGLAGYNDFGLVSLHVKDLEALGQVVIADPQPDDPDHALVVGEKSRSCRRQMSKISTWVIRPPAACP